MQSMKETAANIAASAKSGMEKTKATMQEKVERMTAHDPEQKEMATQKKEGRKAEAEWNKQDVREHNAEARQAASATGGQGRYTTGGSYGAGGGGTGAYGSSGMDTYSQSGGQGRYTTSGPYGAGGGTDAYSTGGIGSGMETYNHSGGQGRYTTSGPYEAGGGTDAYGRGGIGSGMETYSHSTTGAPGQRMGTCQMSATPGHGTGQPYGGLVEEGVLRTRSTGVPGETRGHNTHAEETGHGTENTRTRSNAGSGYGTGDRY